jgi:hypothetical protein
MLVANAPAAFLLKFFPKKVMKRKPINGNKGMRLTNFSMAYPFKELS